MGYGRNRPLPLWICAAMILLTILTGCGNPQEDMIHTGEPGGAEPNGSLVYSVWAPYWDYQSAAEEIALYGENLCSVISFAAVFAHDGSVELPTHLEACTMELQKSFAGAEVFLSVTNDVKQPDGSYLMKDTAILYQLFESGESIAAHIEELIALADLAGVRALEIDYEAMKDDLELLGRFASFIERLYKRALSEGIALRVVLGYDTAEKISLPDGPQYVVMCYNLYGLHGGPGPKADAAFLKRAFEANKALPGEVEMAFANGGFKWDSAGGCVAVTQQEALYLLYTNNMTTDMLERDATSKSLRFTYTDANGVEHGVWFADGETMAYWIGLAAEAGYEKIGIWRGGGNLTSEVRQLFGAKRAK